MIGLVIMLPIYAYIKNMGESQPVNKVAQQASQTQYKQQESDVRIGAAQAIPGNGTFTISGKLANYGSINTQNNNVTAIIMDRSGQEMGRASIDLGTILAKREKPFSAVFNVEPSLVGSYRIMNSAKYWKKGI